jgi:ribonuclease P protein subunit RPR2
MPMVRKKRRKEETKAIAKERIAILLTRADRIYKHEPNLAQRYGELARKIAMKAQIRMPEKWRFRYCRNCKAFLYPGINCHIRLKATNPSRVVLYCEICQNRQSKVYENSDN